MTKPRNQGGTGEISPDHGFLPGVATTIEQRTREYRMNYEAARLRYEAAAAANDTLQMGVGKRSMEYWALASNAVIGIS
jgi:hypothetical protein